MGTIIDYVRMVKGNEVKNIFKYSSGKATMNNIVVQRDINQVIYKLLTEGWKMA